MKVLMPTELVDALQSPLRRANLEHAARYPGERAERQPIHTVHGGPEYGGAHNFRSDISQRFASAALEMLDQHAPDSDALAEATDLDPEVCARIYPRIREKITREPIEDYRIDFEDGFGIRPDRAEDAHAESAAFEVNRGANEGTLPPFLGVRVKPFSEEFRARAFRTLNIFLSTLCQEGRARLPENFLVMLPKVNSTHQVAALTAFLDSFENIAQLPPRSIKIALEFETVHSIFAEGRLCARDMVSAADGRCTIAYFGPYDYTASLGITTQEQRLDHPGCDFARHALQVALVGTGVWLCDGAPLLTPIRGNQESVHRAWRHHVSQVRRSLAHGYYQGWDTYPGTLISRYAAVYSFFQETLPSAVDRLRSFMEKARDAQATMLNGLIEEAATGHALLNFFLRGLSVGAITEAEILPTGLTSSDLRLRSFAKILEARGKPAQAARAQEAQQDSGSHPFGYGHFV